MKNNILILMLLLSSTLLYGQAEGDMQTTASGTESWKTVANWQVWKVIDEVGSWSAASTAPSEITTTVTVNREISINNFVSITGNGKLIISPTGKLTNIEIFNSGKIIVGGNGLLIQATSSGSGQLLSNWDLIGTKQTFLTGGKWHLVGSPVNNTDAFTVFNGFYMQQYKEEDNSWVGHADLVNFNPTMALGSGYSAWKSDAATISYVGTLNSDDVPINLYNVEEDTLHGYNLLSNPYSCGLEFTSDWTRVSVNNEVHIWGIGIGSYVGYNNGDGFVIPASQGFFMRATGASAASVIMPKGSRTISANANPYKNSAVDEIKKTRLLLQNTENDYADELQFEFNDIANLNYNGETDATKMFGSELSPDLFMLTGDDVAVCIKGLDANQNSTLRMQLRPNVNASYRITAKKFTFDPTTVVLLEDLFTTDGPMTVDASLDYTFTSQATDDESRFVIYVRPAATGIDNPIAESQFNIFGSKDFVRILSSESNYKLSVYNLLGQKLVEKNNLEGNASIDLSAFKQTIVLVSIQSEKEFISKKIQLK